jgi:hypothetical protein
MLADPTGWNVVLWHVNGPNEKFPNTASQVGLTDATTGAAFSPFILDQSFDTLNVLKMSSFELNKTWRVKPLHNGAILEPMVGYRYMNVRDFYQRETMTEVPVGVPPIEFFAVDNISSQFENNMHGIQLGARLFRQRGHWMLSSDIRLFGMANFQTLRRNTQQSFLPNPDQNTGNVIVDVIGPLPLPFPTFPTVGGDVNRSIGYQHNTQFVFGGELRGEASYELTRDINLRVGFVFLDLGQGIGRGNLMRFNNQGVQMAGATFGFTVNR